MSPITKRRLAALLVFVFPVAAWIITASIAGGVWVKHWNLDHFITLAYATPQYAPLYIWPAIGFILAVGLFILIAKGKKTEGFEGASYNEFIRGTKVVPAKKLRQLCTESAPQIEVATIPMPIKVENLHLMIGGATGSGKSVLLKKMASSVRKRRERMFVIDPNGDLMSKFYQPGDIVLNPYDIRSVGWVFYNEVRADYDWKRLAHSLVPMSHDKSAEEWNDYGRLLLRETAKKMYHLGNTSIMELFRLCTIESPEKLKKFLDGTLAESLFTGSSEASKALSSARFVLSNKLSEHTSMPAGDFSIRHWLEDPNGGNLFINWREDMSSAMKPLVSAWADVFITSVLSMSEDRNRRWWMFIDELASLEALPSLEAGLTKGRKNGLRIVAGLQSTSQLEHIYGEKMATTIRASFRNLAVLGGSKTDPKTAEDMSKSLGEHEIKRYEYNVSRSVDTRNTSDQFKRETERVVTPSEIQAFKEMMGYVAFAGDYPIAKIQMTYETFPTVIEPFVESAQLGRID
ncbi:type IV secretion system DNA-binding domain-containing protein [Advenella sp. EE-W14]|uniref:type IV secretion system DNA-binding domain-containing protein n=1 Tax=Advenella sp. EE-W14 TaxID=2722705 RepID=UPI00145EEF01|nr:type IV secretion system DNA-binding domain-containing protein [Advenella sp. EE-W14]